MYNVVLSRMSVPSTSSSASSTENANVTPRSKKSMILTPVPPYPPNWHERYQHTVTSLQNYSLFPVGPNTSEFDTIALLLAPTLISTVEQVVNPSLWLRFVNTRKEMLKSKSNDLELLSKLELNQTELLATYQHSLNFESNPKLLDNPYNDNMALLFHCTRKPENIENIMRHGLDERMGSGGLLGKGIYFSDDPKKSMMYDGCGGIIFIFAVLLGDCLTLDGRGLGTSNYVREPEKNPEHKRNINDFFYDSIVGQPYVDNEYVIYNRYQCCPLYKIKYSPESKSSTAKVNNDIYVQSRKYFPPFAWMSAEKYNVASGQLSIIWPFYAEALFAKMGSSVEDKIDKPDNESKQCNGLIEKLNFLCDLGFHDLDKNIENLRKHNFCLEECVDELLNS